MRKVSLLILLVFCSNIFIWSQNEKNTSKEDGIKKNEIFISYAKEIGLDSLKATTILSLIEKRKNDLQALNNQKVGDEISELFESTDLKTKSISKIEQLKKIEQLTDDQDKEITTMMETFYFNEETITAYYAFDKELQRQKLSALRFRFEKKYEELRAKLNLEVKSNVNVNNRTYLWNN